MTSTDDVQPPARQPAPGPLTVIRAAGSVIAPLTLITGLMYYFGLIHAASFYAAFGVDYSVFDLSSEDFVVRSADGLFIPFTLAALVVLLSAWLFQLALPRSSPAVRRRVIRAVVPVASALGLVLMVVATIAAVRPGLELFLRWPGTGGVCLVLGVLALLAAIRAGRWLWQEGTGRDRPRPPPSWLLTEWVAVVLLVSVGLFWAVGDWSAGVGQRRAAMVVDQLPSYPELVLYTDQDLDLSLRGVAEVRCEGGEPGNYRYDGLRLVRQENGLLFILPAQWRPADGSAVVLKASHVLRMEFHSPQVVDPQDC